MGISVGDLQIELQKLTEWLGQLKQEGVCEIDKLGNYVAKNKPRVAYFTRNQGSIDAINKQRAIQKAEQEAAERERKLLLLKEKEDAEMEQQNRMLHSPISNDGMEDEEED